jgi:SpoIID/LytB domain protein
MSMRILKSFFAATVLASSLAVATQAAPAFAAYGPTISFVGHGEGHGRGLGQWGAYGYALYGGKTSAWILDHYYGNTYASTVAAADLIDPVSKAQTPNMTVRLLRMDNLATTVSQDKGHLTLTDRYGTALIFNGSNQLTAARAEFNPITNLYDISASNSCVGTFTHFASVAGPVTFDVAPANKNDASTDVQDLLGLCEQNGYDGHGPYERYYSGTIRTAIGTAGEIRTVNAVPLELYVQGVVPRESIASWGNVQTINGLPASGQAALEAQAVAARTYALDSNNYSYAKTCDDTNCQMYGADGFRGIDGAVTGELPQCIDRCNNSYLGNNTKNAVASTAGVVRRMNNTTTLAYTEFGSSNGGYTSGGPFTAVTDDYDYLSYFHTWHRTVSTQAFIDRISSKESVVLGSLIDVSLVKDGVGEDGGRVISATVRGTGGSVTISGERFRSDIYSLFPGFPDGGFISSWFTITTPVIARPAVAVAGNPAGAGYWVGSANGAVYSFGGTAYYGSAADVSLAKPMVAMAPTPSGAGYWLLGGDGGIFTYGDAGFYGSTGAMTLNKPVVGMASTPSGKGYWLVASDGGIFTFGDAGFYGSTGAMTLNKPVVGMARTASGNGYWMVGSDGGIFTFGDAGFFGSMGAATLPGPVHSMAANAAGTGYWLESTTGDVYAFGTATP